MFNMDRFFPKEICDFSVIFFIYIYVQQRLLNIKMIYNREEKKLNSYKLTCLVCLNDLGSFCFFFDHVSHNLECFFACVCVCGACCRALKACQAEQDSL